MREKFSDQELQNADAALRLSQISRPSPEESFPLLLELSQHLPVRYLAALLDTTEVNVRRWLNHRTVHPNWQRMVYLTHFVAFCRTEVSFLHLAAWGRSEEPKIRRVQGIKRQIMFLLLEWGKIAPGRIVGAVQNRMPRVDAARIEAAVTEMVEHQQIIPTHDGFYKPQKLCLMANDMLAENEAARKRQLKRLAA